MKYFNELEGEFIFVFGSNTAGRHGKSAALYARQHHGAKYGRGIGRTGDSYAIPTKDDQIKSLPLEKIQEFIDNFIEYAKEHPELKFKVTRIGCGLVDYSPYQMAFMFKDAPDNCYFDPEWEIVLK